MNLIKDKRRIFNYFIGLLLVASGVGLSIKSNLGVSPVSSIPYTITCITGMDVGKATIIFQSFLLLLQILILRKQFPLKNVLQIPAAIVFGTFTSFSTSMIAKIPLPDFFFFRLAMVFVSTMLIALGFHLYVFARLIPLVSEGLIMEISEKYDKKFSSIKLIFEITVVSMSLITCLMVLRNLGSVGLGTIISSVMVGIEMKWIARLSR